MKGDFTRMTFDPKKHYNRVLMQQGRVQLDADWNEQLDISAYRMETGTADTVGRCGTPSTNPGFRLFDFSFSFRTGIDFTIGAGRYYVDGTLCENEDEMKYSNQPNLPRRILSRAPSRLDPKIKLPEPLDGLYLVYLDVWDRHITALDDESIREKALGGPDTATRCKTIWQVKLKKLGSHEYNCATALLPTDNSTGLLSARVKLDEVLASECEVMSRSGYRRLENQLYRVEIHENGKETAATFKWSRDNGSMVTTWKNKNGNVLTVGTVRPDQVLGFQPGQWIELIDDTTELQGKPGTLVKLVNLVGPDLTIDPTTATGSVDYNFFPLNPKVRRWDTITTVGGVRNVNDSDTADKFIQLEDGIEIKFEKGDYNTGDYWLIPARAADNNVEWPHNEDSVISRSKHGIYHHYCSLGILELSNNGKLIKLNEDCRRKFPSLTDLMCLYYVSGDGQEGTPGQSLPKPLKVGVANGNQPVKNAHVKFAILKDDDSEVSASIITTNMDGVAQFTWTLGAADELRMRAQLLDSDDKPLHLPIIFTAQFSQGDAAELGIHVTGIAFKNGPVFHNDTNVSALMLARGIQITCDDVVRGLSIGSRLTSEDTHVAAISPTIYVTLDLPYPLNSAEPIIGYQSVVLSSEVNKDNNYTISWTPTEDTKQWLVSQLFQKMLDYKQGYHILAHLILKGNFIWSAKSPDLYLEGEVFGVEGKDVSGTSFIEAHLPREGKRRGGDCEFWFWLTPLPAPKVILITNKNSRVLVKLSAPRRKALGQIINLVLDRAALRDVVPSEYGMNLDQAQDVSGAIRLASNNKLQGLSLNLWASTPFGNAVLMLVDMLALLKINLQVITADSLLDKLHVAIAAGDAPDMVLCDSALSDQLSQMGYDFTIVTL